MPSHRVNAHSSEIKRLIGSLWRVFEMKRLHWPPLAGLRSEAPSLGVLAHERAKHLDGQREHDRRVLLSRNLR